MLQLLSLPTPVALFFFWNIFRAFEHMGAMMEREFSVNVVLRMGNVGET
jgi:hypothetical protein